MFQRRQNSVSVVASYGQRKFSDMRNPNIRLNPIAMSEYPERSK